MRKKKSREMRVCACGECGETFECEVTSKQRFIYGHQNRGRRSLRRVERETRICAAPGCNTTFECKVTNKKKYCCRGHSMKGKPPWNKGLTKETSIALAKMGDTKRGRTKENHSGKAAQAEKLRGRTKENHPGVARQSKKMIGRKQSKEERVKRVETRKNNGEPWHSKKTKEKIGSGNLGSNNGMFGRCRELHPNWQGDTFNRSYPFEFNEEFKELIRERYNYTCMICKRKQEQLRRKLDVHHIDYDKDNLDPDDFVPLCDSCHGATNGSRTYWTKVLRSVVEINKPFKEISV